MKDRHKIINKFKLYLGSLSAPDTDPGPADGTHQVGVVNSAGEAGMTQDMVTGQSHWLNV